MWTGRKSSGTRRLLASLCVCLLLLGQFGQCSAQTYPLSEQDLIKLEAIFLELKQTSEVLLQDSTKSALDLIEAQKQLRQSQKELLELKELLMRLQAESIQAKSELIQSGIELQKANQSLTTYAKETKAKINSLTWQRNIGYAAFVAALIFKK